MRWFRRKTARKAEAPRFAPIGGKTTGTKPTRRDERESPGTRPEPPAMPPVPEPGPIARADPAPRSPRTATPAELRRTEFALAEGIVSRDLLLAEMQRSKAEATPLGRALLGLDYPDMAEIAGILGRVAIPRIDLDKIGPTDEALTYLPAETARARDCLPLAIFGNIICVAMARPEDLMGIREIRDVTGRRVKALRAEGAAVRGMIARHYGSDRRRRFRLRPLPISDEAYERARSRNRLANEVVTDWERVWLHGEASPAIVAIEN